MLIGPESRKPIAVAYMPIDLTWQLGESGFKVALLDVAVAELARRDNRRLAEQGWTNRQWFDYHQTVMGEHRDAGLIDHVIDGERDSATVAADILALLRNRAGRHTATNDGRVPPLLMKGPRTST